MGNSGSHLCAREPEWDAYLQAPWRAARARELDRMGGPAREAVARQKSFDAKLAYLGGNLLAQAQSIDETLHSENRTSAPTTASSSTRAPGAKPRMSVPGSLPAARAKPHWAAEHEAGDAERALAREQRRRMMLYGSTASMRYRRHTAEPAQLPPAPASATAAVDEGGAASSPARSAYSSLAGASQAFQAPPGAKIAPWRVHVYAARRRVMLIVRAVVRLKLGVLTHGRLRRVDSFSVYVGKALGPSAGRVVEEQRRAQTLHREMEALKMLMAGEEPASSGDSNHSTLDPSDASASGPVVDVVATLRQADGPGGPAPRRSTGSGKGRLSDGSGWPAPSPSQPGNSRVVQLPPVTPLSTPFTGSALPRGGQGASSPGEQDHARPQTSAAALPGRPSHQLVTVRENTPLALGQEPRPGTTLGRARGSSLPAASVAPSRRVSADNVLLGPPAARATPPPFSAFGSSSRGARGALSPTASSGAPAGGTGRLLNSLSAHGPPTAPLMRALEQQQHKEEEEQSGAGRPGRAAASDGVGAALAGLREAMEAVPEEDRERWLQDSLSGRASALQHSQQLVRMFVNRANAQRVEQQSRPWRSPSPWDAARCARELGAPALDRATDEVRDALAQGQVAVMLMCAEDDHLALPDGRQADLFAADPWRLVEALRPGCMPPTERVEGVPLGVRVILQLLVAVTELAGPEAASKLTLLVSCSDRELRDLMGEVLGRRFFGMEPQNLIILPQPTWSGHKWSAEEQAWRRDPLGGRHSLGSGYSSFLLSWVGEGMTLDADGELKPLPGSVVETLESRGVKWMAMERLRDTSLLGGGALDLPALAQLALLHRTAGANMAVLCGQTDSNVVARQLDSLLVAAEGVERHAPEPRTSALGAAASPDAGGGRVKGRRGAHASQHGGSQGGADKDDLGLVPVVEVRHSELLSPALLNAANELKAQSPHGQLTVGLHRYLVHLPSLAGMLVGFPFRARLAVMSGGAPSQLQGAERLPSHASTASSSPPSSHPSGPAPLQLPLASTDLAAPGTAASAATQAGPELMVAVTWDVADLLSCPDALCVPLRASATAMGVATPGHPLRASWSATWGDAASAPDAGIATRLLAGADEIPALAALLVAQDHDARFRQLLGQWQHQHRSAQVIRAPSTPHHHGGGAAAGQAVVVLVPGAGALTDQAVATAARLVRPGLDSLHLVTVVPTSLHRAEGEKLLAHYRLAALGCMADIQSQVLVRHPWTLLDVVDWYVMRVGAGLLVMGSTTLTDAPDMRSTSILGSVTLAAAHRLAVPLLVVTARAKPAGAPHAVVDAAHAAVGEYNSLQSATLLAAPGPAAPLQQPGGGAAGAKPGTATSAQAAVAAALGAGGVQAMVLAEGGGAKGMVRWLCGSLLSKARGDGVMLAQVVSGQKGASAGRFKSPQQAANFKASLDSFQNIVTGARLPATKRLQLWGAADKELLAAVAQDPAVSLLAVHLAPGKLPAWLLGLLRSSPVPVLLHKSGDGGIAS